MSSRWKEKASPSFFAVFLALSAWAAPGRAQSLANCPNTGKNFFQVFRNLVKPGNDTLLSIKGTPGDKYLLLAATGSNPAAIFPGFCLYPDVTKNFLILINGLSFAPAQIPSRGWTWLMFTAPKDPSFLGTSFHFQFASVGPNLALGNSNGDSFKVGTIPSYSLSPSRLPDLPVKMGHAPCMEAVGDTVYVAGGNFYSYLYAIKHTAQGWGNWSRLADMSVGRDKHAGLVYGGKIYVFGGEVWNSSLQKTVITNSAEVYDPAKNTWSNLQGMPKARGWHGACEVNGKFYIVGGVDANENTVGTVFEYDPKTSKWTTKAGAMDFPRACCDQVVAHGGKIYVFGGWQDPFPGYETGIILSEYDPVSDKWKTLGNMPRDLGEGAAALLGDKAYIVAETAAENLFDSTGTVARYDFKTKTFSYAPFAQWNDAGCCILTLSSGKSFLVSAGGTQDEDPTYRKVTASKL